MCDHANCAISMFPQRQITHNILYIIYNSYELLGSFLGHFSVYVFVVVLCWFVFKMYSRFACLFTLYSFLSYVDLFFFDFWFWIFGIDIYIYIQFFKLRFLKTFFLLLTFFFIIQIFLFETSRKIDFEHSFIFKYIFVTTVSYK